MSTSKIKAGLAAHERAKTGATSPAISVLLGAPQNIPQLKNAVGGIVERRDRLRKLSETLGKNLERTKAEIEAKYADFGVTREEQPSGAVLRHDEIGADRRRAMIAREIAKFSRAARATTADARKTLLSEIRTLHSKVQAVADAWSHPVAVLDRRTLADPKRATYAANLTNANPVAVAHTMRQAVVTGDGALVMAIVGRLTAFSDEIKAGLPYRSADLALAIPGVKLELDAAREAVALSDYATAQAEYDAADAEGTATVEMKVRVGRLQKTYEEIVPPKVETADDNSDDGDKPPVLFSEQEWQDMLAGKYPSAAVPDDVQVIK